MVTTELIHHIYIYNLPLKNDACVCPTRMVYAWTHTHTTHLSFVRLAPVLRDISSRRDSCCLASSWPEESLHEASGSVGNLQQHRGRLPFLHGPRPGPQPAAAVKRAVKEGGARGRTAADERPRRENHVHRGERSQHRGCAKEISWHTTHGFLFRNPQTPTHPIHPTENKQTNKMQR